MIDDTYVYSYRNKWTNPVFRNLLEAGIWCWMCETASHRDNCQVRFNGELVTLARGQLITARRFIANGFGISEQVTRTYLENLQKAGMINQQPTHRGTLITICNYNKYQKKKTAANPLDNTLPTSSQPTANPNNNKLNTLNKLIQLNIAAEDWNDFEAMRKSIGKPMTDRARKIILNKLEKLKDEGYDIKQILENSITNNWQDVYPPKTKPTNGKNLSQLLGEI